VIRPRLTRRHVGALAVLALGGGAAMAQVAGGSGAAARSKTEASVAANARAAARAARHVGRPDAGARAPARAARRVGRPDAGAQATARAARRVGRPVPAPPRVAFAARPPIGPCVPRRPPAGGPPPSQALLDAFAILRRERTAADELPAAALKALRLRGLEPVAPDAARLLRSAGDMRAWVVPVPDVDRADTLACLRGGARKPREGVAVVALGGAPAGGGGALRELVRGTAQVATDPCAGPSHDMLGVSGIVPDGVPVVFLTAPDGSAVRADVHENGFSFVVSPGRRPDPRYVVWTGTDGTPHVQPVSVFAGFPEMFCRRAAAVPEVTPTGAGECAPLALIAPGRGKGGGRVFLVPRPARPPVVVVPRKRGRRVSPAALPMPPPCVVGGDPPFLGAPPAVPPRAMPAPVRPAPLPATPPRKHGP
jgi:hypothetical protein